MYLDRFPSHNEKILRSHRHETHELVAKKLLDFIGLFDANADANGVDGAFD